MTTSLTYGSVNRGAANGNEPGGRVAEGREQGEDASEWSPLIQSSDEKKKKEPKYYKNNVRIKKLEEEESTISSSPSGSSIFGRLIFHWFTPILHRGNAKKRLDQDDLNLIELPLDCQANDIIEKFDLHWQDELQQQQQNAKDSAADRKQHQPSLARALFAAFGADYIRAGALKLVHDLCVFVGPQVLHAIIVFLRTPDAPLWQGLLLTLGVTLSQIAMSLCLRHYFFKCYTTGLRVRSAIVLSVYRKALRLSASERQTKSLGEITNLMSIDAQRLQDLMNFLHALWYSPLQIGLALYFLWQQLGVSSLGGVAVIIIMIPVTKSITQWMASMQRQLMQAKDRRVEVNSEVLSGMKVIKLQAWEEPFSLRILQLRSKELAQLFKYFLGTAISRMLWTFTPLGVALATFAAYVLLGHKLDVASALTALALFDILRFPLFMFPRIVNGTVEAYVSVQRLQSFLMCADHEPVTSVGIETVSGVQMRNVSAAYDSNKTKIAASFLRTEISNEAVEKDSKLKQLIEKSWDIALLQSQLQEAEQRIRELSSASTVPYNRQASSMTRSYDEASPVSTNLLCLKRVDFECRPGQIVAVVGGVGCGKSSLVNAIFGEVRLLAGSTAVKGKLAYFSQTPFVMNASVRENILFSHIDDEQIDEERYQRTIDCCALRHDLELLPDGDATEIGEKGITLSGGQKARVALARAVYHQADITVIDDALAAVDAHVAVHLFEQAIVRELMRTEYGGATSRSVILVTNAIQYLKHKRVDKIVVIQEGRIVEQGTYADLANRKDSVFSRFVSIINETGVSAGEMDASSMGVCREAEDTKSTDDKTEVPDSVVKSNALAKKLMTEEARQTGHVSPAVYFAWCKAAGGFWVPIAVIFIFTVAEGMSVLSNWWLTYWSAHGAGSQLMFLAIYAGINVSAVVVGVVRMILLAFIGITASRRVRFSMFECFLA